MQNKIKLIYLLLSQDVNQLQLFLIGLHHPLGLLLLTSKFCLQGGLLLSCVVFVVLNEMPAL